MCDSSSSSSSTSPQPSPGHEDKSVNHVAEAKKIFRRLGPAGILAVISMSLPVIGMWLLLGTMTPVFVAPLFLLALSIVFIPAEERMKLKQFGEEYRAYHKKVRPWS